MYFIMNHYIFQILFLKRGLEYQLVKEKRFAKIFDHYEEKGPTSKKLLAWQIILWKMQRFSTMFCNLIWLSLAN